MRAFNAFLERLIHGQKAGTRNPRKDALLEYLQSQLAPENTAGDGMLPDLVQIWQHSLEVNFENLFSSVAGALALLLKSISRSHEFATVGNELCRNLLHADNSKLFTHGLTANINREHMISPCLRLLKEITVFDGGKAARVIYRSRHVTFQRLDAFLAVEKSSDRREEAGRKRMSIRSLAIEYLMFNLSLQDRPGRIFLLCQHKWKRAMFQNLAKDPPSIIIRVLSTFTPLLAEHSTLPAKILAQYFDEWTLSRIAALYSYVQNDSQSLEASRVKNSTDGLLHLLCASKESSLLHRLQEEVTEHTRATKGADQDGGDEARDYVQPLAYESQASATDLSKATNSIGSFLRNAHLQTSVRLHDLVLASLKIYPELVAQTFASQQRTLPDPSLATVWLNQIQFFLKFLQQPLDHALIMKALAGDEISIQRSLQELLPMPLTQKVLTKCLNQSSDLVASLSSQLLIAAFQRFIQVQSLSGSANDDRDSKAVLHGKSAYERIAEDFLERCPHFKIIVARYRSCSEAHTLLRECLSKLALLYHSAAPSNALIGDFDVSSTLSKALVFVSHKRRRGLEVGLNQLGITHLIEIAQSSAATRWWYKPGNIPSCLNIQMLTDPYPENAQLSVFSLVLRYQIHEKYRNASSRVSGALQSVLEESGILSPKKYSKSFKALTYSLSLEHGDAQELQVYCFLDNCLHRLTQKAVHYRDILENSLACGNASVCAKTNTIDLLVVAVIDQLPHLRAQRPVQTVSQVMYFFRHFLHFSGWGPNDGLASGVLKSLLCNRNFESQDFNTFAMGEPSATTLAGWKVWTQSDNVNNKLKTLNRAQFLVKSHEISVPDGPAEEDEKHRALSRWVRGEAQDVVKEGTVGELAMYLSSTYQDIRIQALAALRKFAALLKVCLPPAAWNVN